MVTTSSACLVPSVLMQTLLSACALLKPGRGNRLPFLATTKPELSFAILTSKSPATHACCAQLLNYPAPAWSNCKPQHPPLQVGR